MKKLESRYEFFGPNGIQWTKWFRTSFNHKEKYQYKSGSLVLKNEYREVEVDK